MIDREQEPNAEQFAIKAALRTMIPQCEASPGEIGDLENSLAEFMKRAWHVVEPGVDLKWSWHLDAISEHLQAVSNGEIKQLLINVPPGCSKSLLTCVFWPAWEWARDPSKRWMFASYDQKLSIRDSMRCRFLLQSAWYQNRWGFRVQFARDANLKTYFENTALGYRLATSVGGHATGEHPDRIVCFPAGTKVTTDAGEIPIEKLAEISHDVSVLSSSGSGAVWSDKFSVTSRYFGERLVTVSFFSGRKIECTPDHLVYVHGLGYVKAGQLTSGQEVVTDEISMQALPEGLLREAEQENPVLLPQVLADVAPREEHEPMRDVRDARVPASGARCTRQDILQSQMSREGQQRDRSSSICWSKAELRGVRKGDFGCVGQAARAGEVLLAEMPGEDSGRAPSRQAVLDSLRSLRHPDMDGWQAGEKSSSLLWTEMRRLVASVIFDRQSEREVQARDGAGDIPGRIRSGREGSKTEGRPLLPAVRKESRREWQEGNERPSYRHRHDKQLPRQPDLSLRLLSRWRTWREETRSEVAKDTVVDVSVGRHCETVYCLKVDGLRNYFANGVLVHNCDDPHAVGRAESADQRQTVIDWWDNTISTRGVSRDVSRVIVMQRLHQRDLSGHILSSYADWDHINLAMRFECDSMKKPTSLGWIDPRQTEGDLLSDQQFSEERVAALEDSLGSYGSSAQLQQRPSPKGGGLIQRDWLKYCHERPQGNNVRRCRFWDLAASEKKSADYTVGALLSAKITDGVPTYYIENIQRDRWSPARRDARMKSMAEIDGRDVAIRIEKEPGASGLSLCNQIVRMLAGWDARGVRPTGSKIARMHGFAAQAEIGNIYIVRPRATEDSYWIEAMLDEFENFPTGEHDDCVDACAGAFNYLTKTPIWTDHDLVGDEEDADFDTMKPEDQEEFLASLTPEVREFFE